MEKLENSEQFIIEAKHTFSRINSNSEFRQEFNINIIENLDPSRLPALITKMKANTYQMQLNLVINNPSLCENDTSSGITGSQGVVKRVVARPFERDRD